MGRGKKKKKSRGSRYLQTSSSNRQSSTPATEAGSRRLRVRLLVALGGLALVALSFWLQRFLDENSSRPRYNVLLISVDTLRADHLGIYGYDRPTSPRMDTLGQQGVVFTSAICQNTNTNPSHASILSGLYPRTHGNWDNYYLMDEEVLLAPEVFQEAGYRTAAFLSGYTMKAKICGLQQGFGLYEDGFDGKERRGDQTTDLALQWLRTHAGESFFLFVHLFDPHGPYLPPAAQVDAFQPRQPPAPVPWERIPKYQRLPRDVPETEVHTDLNLYKARYDGEIAFADQQVGRLLDALEELELADRTVVILTSDHGEALDERYHLLDHGGGIGDEEIRIPLIFRFPDRRHAGLRFDAQVESIDILPTLLGALDLDYPEPVQGANLLPLLQAGGGTPHPYALTETRVIPSRWGDRSFKPALGDTLKAVRSETTKLVVFPGNPGNYLELYDLASDPLETNDIYQQRPELADEMVDQLTELLQIPTRHNKIANPDNDPDTRDIFCSLGYIECED